jgi:hypothetical protein
MGYESRLRGMVDEEIGREEVERGKKRRLDFGKELSEKGIGYMMYLDRRVKGKRRKVVVLWGWGKENGIMEKYGFKRWKDRGLRGSEYVWVRKE